MIYNIEPVGEPDNALTNILDKYVLRRNEKKCKALEGDSDRGTAGLC